VFSVTLVALSLAATQYSPRVIRTFMHDRPTQSVLGVFVAVFAYCLVVIRAIRGGEALAFVPSLAVFGGMVLAFVAIGFLVYFIHHLAAAIEVSSILARLAEATRRTIDTLYPRRLEDDPETDEQGREAASRILEWVPVPALQGGYIVAVDRNGLFGCARELERVVRMEAMTGDFVVEGEALLWLSGGTAVSTEQRSRLDGCYARDRLRTVEQDAAFGLQQIVDVALKALSPGINDQTTAIMCVDRLAELMSRLAGRRMQATYHREHAVLRLIAVERSFGSLLQQTFDPVRIAAASHRMVLERLRWALERVGDASADPERRSLVRAMMGQVERSLAAAPA